MALSAMRLVLARKASRFRLVVDLLERDLGSKTRRAEAGELEGIVAKGWGMVKHAKF